MSYAEELQWLIDNPAFAERPATIREFMGPQYLNIEGMIRPSIMKCLEDIIGVDVNSRRLTEFPLAMITGGIGIGKTTIASVVMPYLCHWVMCLNNPQQFFGLLPGSRIAFMQMSTSGQQAKDVIFGDIKARIEYSPWFQAKYPYDKDFKNSIRFPQKDIWILPGDSAETTFEGYNILGGILDEADSHKVTLTKDYAEQGFTTIHTRIVSRFGDRGFLLVIGQMKKSTGFAARKFEEFRRNPKAYTVRMALWDSFGWEYVDKASGEQLFLNPDGTRKSFWYDCKRHEIVPTGAALLLPEVDTLIEVPELYRQDFANNPEKALRDLAGIPPATGSPFISLVYKVEEARDRWLARVNKTAPDGSPMIESPVDSRGQIAPWFRAMDSLPRVLHIDLAYSADGDALGIAMAHVPEMVTIEGENKPFIQVDLLLRIHAPAGREIFLGDVRRIVYDLRENRGFKIKMLTMDGFQSTDTRQQFQRRRIPTDILSVDKTALPYYDLRDAIYDDRIAFPKYQVRLRNDDVVLTEILVKELIELVDNGDKVDHPEGGSKDIADSVAGCVYTLMGDRSFHRRTVSIGIHQQSDLDEDQGHGSLHPAIRSSGAMRAPLPPSGMTMPNAWRPPARRR